MLMNTATREGRETMSNDTTTEAPKAITPKALAEELDIDAKRLRSYLRSNFTRAAEAKNTTWVIDTDTADAARAYFTPADDTDVEVDTDEA